MSTVMAQQFVGTTTMAAPTYANTVSYAAAPTVTTMAAPVTYAPSVTTMAAPATYAAAPATYAAPYTMPTEYAGAPVTYAMPQAIVAPPAPAEPVKLTQGIPTPEQIAQQKAGYSAALDKQLKEAIETVGKEMKIEKDMMQFTAEKNKALYKLQVEEQLAADMAALDELECIRLLELTKAKVERNLQLDAQANQLTMDYKVKAVQTELAQKQYEFQVQYVQAEDKLAAQYNQQVAVANTGTTYAAPAQLVR